MSINESSALLSDYQRWSSGTSVTGYSLKRRQLPSGGRSRSRSPAENTLAQLLWKHNLDLWSEAGASAQDVRSSFLSRTLSQPAKGSADPRGPNRREHSISDLTVAAAVQYIERCGQGDQARFPIILGHGQDNRLELKQRPAHAPSLWSTLKTSVSRRLVPEYVQQEWKDYTLYLWPKESTLPKSKLPNPYQDKTLGWYLYNREMNLSKGMVRSSDPLNEAPFVDLLKWQCSDQTVLSLNNLAKKLGNLKGRHRNKASYYAAVVLKVQIPRHSLDASKSRKARSPNEVLGTIVNIQPDRKNLEYVGMSNNRGGYIRTPYCILPEPEPSDS